MAEALPYVVLPIAILVGLFFVGVECRDATQQKQTDIQNTNWAGIPTWDNHKSTTTPWPTLGGNRYGSSTKFEANPSWVRPVNGGQTATFYSPSRSNSTPNFNVGPASGQKNNVPSSSSEVTDEELREFSESLLTQDVNNAAKYVTFDLQKKTTSRSTVDEAPLPLLHVDPRAFGISSIKTLMKLHDNYILETTAAEDYTPDERQEEEAFLDSVINTPVMRSVKNFLAQKGKSSEVANFKNLLRDIWFAMYKRGARKVSSSGFEHVFLAEIKNGQISGLHNWLYFNEQEKANNVNYLGYMKKLDLGENGAIVRYHFTLRGIDKPVGSMFIGTSPEFEMALYTTCFLLRADKICPLKLNGNRFVIRTFTYRYNGQKMIGSAFPDI